MTLACIVSHLTCYLLYTSLSPFPMTLSCSVSHLTCYLLHTSLFPFPMTLSCSVSHLVQRRKELELQVVRERELELGLHEEWKALVQQLAAVKSDADARERSARRQVDALR